MKRTTAELQRTEPVVCWAPLCEALPNEVVAIEILRHIPSYMYATLACLNHGWRSEMTRTYKYSYANVFVEDYTGAYPPRVGRDERSSAEYVADGMLDDEDGFPGHDVDTEFRERSDIEDEITNLAKECARFINTEEDEMDFVVDDDDLETPVCPVCDYALVPWADDDGYQFITHCEVYSGEYAGPCHVWCMEHVHAACVDDIVELFADAYRERLLMTPAKDLALGVSSATIARTYSSRQIFEWINVLIEGNQHAALCDLTMAYAPPRTVAAACSSSHII